MRWRAESGWCWPRDALIADIAPPEIRGTAFGCFNLVSGLALLFASALAGLLWDSFGAAYAFIGGGLFSAAALAAILLRGTRPGGS